MCTSDVEIEYMAVIELCPNADLTLIVGEFSSSSFRHHRFKVSRNTLCMASSVFRAMLSGNFIEAQKDEIELEDDDPDALLIILRIVHLRFSEVKRSFEHQSQLVNVAVVCDKYDLVAVCRPFVPGWVRKWLRAQNPIPNLSAHGQIEMCLWTWVFGYEEEFCYLVNFICLTSSFDDDGNFRTMAEGKFTDENLPLSIVGE